MVHKKMGEKRKDVHLLPLIEESLDAIAGAQWFSTLDMASGYNQIPVAEGDKAKTSVRTTFGLSEFVQIPQVCPWKLSLPHGEDMQ